MKPETRVALAVTVAALVAYAVTAARTITWWDGSHYPLLAYTLGITNAPGSLLLTLLGWLGTRVRVVAPVAFQFNLLAAAMGALAAGAVARIAAALAREDGQDPDGFALAGAAAAGLVFAFSFHVWTYATQFTPYILTALFTGVLCLALLHWWVLAGAGDAAGALFVLALLFGLDVSVHRTNLLWLPAALVAVGLRRPGSLRRWRTWLALTAGFPLGLAFQLGYLVLSRRKPFLDVWEPRTLSALARFERLDGLGGGFLVDLWPRRADFVRVQLADWLAFLWRDLGADTPTRVAALLLALAGLLALARRSRRLALAMLACFLAAGLGGVLYFNRPAEYFRPLDRHYLPSWVLLAPWIGVGLAAATRWLHRPAPRRVAGAVAAGAVAALGALALSGNLRACDRSHTRLAETFARDLLEPLPRDAILVTNGDNDTFPLWYLQQAEGLRTDVLVVNEPVTMTSGGVRRLRRADPAFAKLALSDHVVDDLIRANDWRRPVHFAVTLASPLHAALQARGEVQGLSWRIPGPADSAGSDEPLRRFVLERLPRAGLADPRQVVEPDIRPMLRNYAAAGFQFAARQARGGDTRAALATLDLLERNMPWGGTGEDDAEVRKTLTQMRAGLRTAPPRAPGQLNR